MEIRTVYVGGLRLPPERSEGAVEYKLQRQIDEFGSLIVDIPALLVIEDCNEELMIMDGVTRAVRAYLIDSAALVAVEVISSHVDFDFSSLTTISERYQ